MIVRYCHPCKASGNRVPADFGASGVNRDRRARVGKAIVNVCKDHAEGLTVARAEVSGSGTEARQAAEVAIFDADAATILQAKHDDLQANRDRAASYLTPEAYARIVKGARYSKGSTTVDSDMMREARYDAVLDAVLTRIGDRIFRGEDVDVDRIVEVALFSNTSERSRRLDVRWDAPANGVLSEGSASGDFVTNDGGNTLGAIFSSTLDSLQAEDETTATEAVERIYRVAGRTITHSEMMTLAYEQHSSKAVRDALQAVLQAV